MPNKFTVPLDLVGCGRVVFAFACVGVGLALGLHDKSMATAAAFPKRLDQNETGYFQNYRAMSNTEQCIPYWKCV